MKAERPKPTGTERHLDRSAVEALPARSADDLLRAMPGLHQSAHGGHGKAYQYFLRGFDAVHGADLAVDVAGVPVNELSNVHAHGYLDLHFIPTILVRGVDLHPGTSRVDAGDFAIAGAASFSLGLDDPGTLLRVGGGTDLSGEATVAWRPAAGSPGTFVVAEAEAGRGVGMARQWRQVRVGAGVQGRVGAASGSAWILAYDGEFASPGALREDDLVSGEVGFYDAYAGSGGGRSTRVLAGGSLAGGTSSLAWRATAWAGGRSLSLEQNFTGWYGDETHGDGTRQGYRVGTFGLSALGFWNPAAWLALRAGTQARLDVLEQETYGVTPAGAVWERQGALSATQAELGGWASARLEPTPWLVLEPGARTEVFLVRTDTTAWAPVLAPKLSIRLFEDSRATGFASYGRGYRSPDARGAGDGRAPVSLADAFEVGVSSAPTRWLSARAAGFATLVNDEIVFDHVSARYLATGSTRRLGIDAGLSVTPHPHLRVDADCTWTRGVYVATGAAIPYAPPLVVTAGVYAERLTLGPWQITAGVRGWVLGPRPLPGGFQSQTVAVADLTSTVERGPWGVGLDVDNLFGTRWRDGEFVFSSHWDRTEARAELPARHFTAGAPFAVRLALSRRF